MNELGVAYNYTILLFNNTHHTYNIGTGGRKV